MEFAAKTRPCLFFSQAAEEAATFYTELLPDSWIERTVCPAPDAPALVVEFSLAGTPYMAMNGNPGFQSTHSFSISVLTDDQAETDTLWDRLLSNGGESGRCGWLKDRFGIHWQIVPKALPRLMSQGGESAQRVQNALMGMSRIDMSLLDAAAKGKEHDATAGS